MTNFTVTQKNTSLEGLRGIASLGVVFSHFIFSFLPHTAQGLTKGAEIKQFYGFETVLRQPFFTVFYNGSFAVAIFFVLSGYVLTKKYFDTGDVAVLQSGAAKRYFRLAIPAFVSVMLALALLNSGAMFNQKAPEIGAAGWPMASYGTPVTLTAAVWDGVIGAPLFGQATMNAPLWTLQIELIGSLLLFATFALLGRRRPLANGVLMIAFATWVFPAGPGQLYCLTIFSGSLIHYFERSLRGGVLLPVVLIVAGVVGGAYDFTPWYDWARLLPMPHLDAPWFNPVGSERYIYNSVGALLLVSGIVGCAPVTRMLSSRLPSYLGRISFAMYLLHWPIICSLSFGLMYLLKVEMDIPYLHALGVTAVATLATTVLASHLFEVWIDQPATRVAGMFSVFLLGRRRDSQPGEPTP